MRQHYVSVEDELHISRPWTIAAGSTPPLVMPAAAVLDLLAVALAYEQWEADLIMSNESWEDPSGFPRLTQALQDRLVEIQAMRNAAKDKALGRDA